MSSNNKPCLIIFRLGSIGDTVVALPCFHAIARAFPYHRRVLLTNALESRRASSAEAVLSGTGLIDSAMYYPLGADKVRHMYDLLRKIRRLKPAMLIYVADRPSRFQVYRDIGFFKLAGVPRIIGASASTAIRLPYIDPSTQEQEEEACRLARSLMPSIGVDLSRSNWDLHLSLAELAKARNALAEVASSELLLAVSPGAKVLAKDWGEHNWSKLVGMLSVRVPQARLVLLGAADEREVADRVGKHARGSSINLCGSLTPREAAAVLGSCDVHICHDSGPMHLAASMGTPCVALFGNYNVPRRWFPYGDNHRVIYERRGVKEITVQNVLNEILLAIQTLPRRNSRPLLASEHR